MPDCCRIWTSRCAVCRNLCAVARSLLGNSLMRLVLVLLAVLLVPSRAAADEGPNAVCDECHAVAGLRYVDDSGESRLYSIDPKTYARSAHRGTPCVSCHSPGYGDSLPHTGRSFWPIYSCVDCHEGLGDLAELELGTRKKELLGSVHGRTLKPRLDCHDCHDPHAFDLVRAADAAAARISASNRLCLDCHGDVKDRAFGHEGLSDAADTHDHFPNPARHLQRLKCVGCHSPEGAGQGHDVLPTDESVSDCAACHSRDDPRYVASYGVFGGGDARDARDEALANVYVIGSTRSVLLDRASQFGFALFLLLVLGHSVRRRIGHAQYAETRWMHLDGPRALVSWHGLQVLLIAGLLVSGLSMHYTDSGLTPIPFRLAVKSHNLLGVANIALWVAFLVVNARSGNLRHYVDRLRALPAELPRQLRYYALGTFRGEAEPFPPGSPSKFNPLQRLAYLGVMYGLMPLSIASGCVLLYPLVAPEQALGHAGLWPTALVHLTAAYLLTLFIVVHVYMISAGPPESPDQ